MIRAIRMTIILLFLRMLYVQLKPNLSPEETEKGDRIATLMFYVRYLMCLISLEFALHCVYYI